MNRRTILAIVAVIVLAAAGYMIGREIAVRENAAEAAAARDS